eukprot:comp20985_c0_seq1/m.43932 comp20985_c0_seq1/g.43932  ORF comp20985_c0_seq1/g.43932 comp20985_c0_seq1/m.43932 type:complete len:454 (+) comp20985_c0_seq1:60-1421(+)
MKLLSTLLLVFMETFFLGGPPAPGSAPAADHSSGAVSFARRLLSGNSPPSNADHDYDHVPHLRLASGEMSRWLGHRKLEMLRRGALQLGPGAGGAANGSSSGNNGTNSTVIPVVIGRNCSGQGYPVFFTEPRMRCNGTVRVNATQFAAQCLKNTNITELNPDDFDSPLARQNFSTICNCTRTRVVQPVCVCPDDQMGDYCELKRQALCGAALDPSPEPGMLKCSSAIPPRLPNLDEDRPCAVLKRDEVVYIPIRVSCRFTNTTMIGVGVNVTRMAARFSDPERVLNDPRLAPAGIAAIQRNFTYWVRNPNFAISYDPLKGDKMNKSYATTVQIYNFYRPAARLIASYALSPAIVNGTQVFTSMFSLGDYSDFYFAGNRLYADIFVSPDESPLGATVSVAQSLVLEIDQKPPRGTKGRWRPGAIVVFVLFILGLIGGAGYLGVRFYRKRKAKRD